MKTMMILAAQLATLLAINQLGYLLASVLHLPLPGNLLGMLLLLGLLASGLVPVRWVEASASLLVRHLTFFFIPITVGLMGFGDLFVTNGPAILVTLIVSAVVGICGAGLSSQRLTSRRARKAP
jgi:holin-like protein